MEKISYNIQENGSLRLFDEINSGEHIIEVSEEQYDNIFNKAVPFKLVDNELVVDEVQIKITKIYEELESTKWVIDEVNEYHANQEAVPTELLTILQERKNLKQALEELEKN